MIHIYSNGNKIAYGIKRYIVDLISEIPQLPTNIAVGSEAFIVEDSSTYMFNSQGQWVRSSIQSSGSGKDGLSAYEVAVQQGYPGTVDEWLEDLKGESISIVDIDSGVPGKKNYITFSDGSVLEVADGYDGEDGFTPYISLIREDNCVRVNVQNVDGEEEEYIYDGKDGAVVQIESEDETTEDGGINKYTWTDGTIMYIRNGSKGSTPVKGVDYFTEEDKNELVNQIIETLPIWEGGEY